MAEIETNFAIILKNEEPGNLAEFTTHFYPPIQLSDSFLYTVGLNKIIFPAKFANVTKGIVQYYSYTEGKMVEKTLEAGYYGNEKEFIDKFNAVLGADKAFYLLGKNEEKPGYLKFETKIEGHHQLPFLKLSKDLALLSGMTESPLTTNETSPFNPHFNSECIFVQCSIAQHCHLNNFRVPIIEVIPKVFNNEDKTNLLQYSSTNINYSNITQQNIDTIQLRLTDLNGETLRFENENRIICVLSVQCSPLL